MYLIKIIEKETGEVVQEMKATSEREADRVKRGASINLNHADFKIEVTSAE